MYENVGKNGRYEVLSNRESGFAESRQLCLDSTGLRPRRRQPDGCRKSTVRRGRPDIMVINKQTDKAIIFELKHVKKTDCITDEVKQKKITEALQDAAEQITKNKYGLDFSGEIETLPIVACGKAFYF